MNVRPFRVARIGPLHRYGIRCRVGDNEVYPKPIIDAGVSALKAESEVRLTSCIHRVDELDRRRDVDRARKLDFECVGTDAASEDARGAVAGADATDEAAVSDTGGCGRRPPLGPDHQCGR